jgi:hypothetical protein
MPADLSDPEYWRFRAQEVLSVAENLLGYGEIKEIMRRIADDYERIAKLTEKNRRRSMSDHLEAEKR